MAVNRNICKCDNCEFTRRNGGYMVCLNNITGKGIPPANDISDKWETVMFIAAAIVTMFFLTMAFLC